MFCRTLCLDNGHEITFYEHERNGTYLFDVGANDDVLSETGRPLRRRVLFLSVQHHHVFVFAEGILSTIFFILNEHDHEDQHLIDVRV